MARKSGVHQGWYKEILTTGSGILKLSIQIQIILMVCHEVNLAPHDKTSFTVQEGDSFDLLCCEMRNMSIKAYTINTPSGDFYPLFGGSVYEDGRISTAMSKLNECGVNIKNAAIEDKGVWECIVYVQDGRNNDTSTLERRFTVEVIPAGYYTQLKYILGIGIPSFICLIVVIACVSRCLCKKLKKKTSDHQNNNLKDAKTVDLELKRSEETVINFNLNEKVSNVVNEKVENKALNRSELLEKSNSSIFNAERNDIGLENTGDCDNFTIGNGKVLDIEENQNTKDLTNLNHDEKPPVENAISNINPFNPDPCEINGSETEKLITNRNDGNQDKIGSLNRSLNEDDSGSEQAVSHIVSVDYENINNHLADLAEKSQPNMTITDPDRTEDTSQPNEVLENDMEEVNILETDEVERDENVSIAYIEEDSKENTTGVSNHSILSSASASGNASFASGLYSSFTQRYTSVKSKFYNRSE